MSKKNRSLSILGYIVFLAFLFEGSARLAFLIPQISKGLVALDEDSAWRRKWVQRHQDSEMNLYYKFDKYDPTKGWSSKPNIKDSQVFTNKTLNTNSAGFRGKVDHSYMKDKKKLRILILGDSFTFGDEVSDDETYAYYLQEALPQTEVINMGMHGYGHDQMLILLKEEGVKYQPDIVILGFLTMDMPRNLLTFRDFAKPKFILERGKLALIGSPVPRPEDILRWDWARPRLLDIFSSIRYKARAKTGALEKDMKDITTAIIMDMVGVIEGIHATPILVYLPEGGEILMAPIAPATTQFEEYMLSMCQLNQKAECFSARPFFSEKILRGENLRLTGHWDPAGQHAAAEAIENYLVEKGHVTVP